MRFTRTWQRIFLIFLLAPGLPHMAHAAGKVQIYALRMSPSGQDASRFSRLSWGGGVSAVVPLRGVHNLLAGAAGLELSNMLSEKTQFQDNLTGLIVEQQTSQDYFRAYLGGRVGAHGRGLLRPHVGSNIALIVYDITTDIVVPNDANRENEIRQNLRSRTESALGWDITLGTDFNFGNKVPVEVGVRFLKTFRVPQQLGAGSVTVAPAYFQAYLGVGIGFGAGNASNGE